MRTSLAVLTLAALLVPSAAGSAARADDAPPRPGLVVLAPAAWLPTLAPYVEVRARTLDVTAVAVEDVLARVDGADAPERIKRFLYRGWREHGVRYALLVGDADTFPVRWMVLDRAVASAHDTAFYASDLYYADVARDDGSFDDWNGRRDGVHAAYYGEVHGEADKAGPIDQDRVSYVPEVAVGRWPVSTVEDLRAVMQKTLAWEARATGDRPPRAVVLHSPGWVDARGPIGAWCDRLAGAGWTVERQLYGGADGAPTPATALAALCAGADLVCHAGHGSDQVWDRCLGPREREALVGAPPSIMVSVGCGTAAFAVQPPYDPYLDVAGLLHRGTNGGEVFADLPPPPAPLQPGRLDVTGLGERLVRMPSGGAVAYIGCNTGAQPCALTLLEGLLASVSGADSAAPRAARLGDAWDAALAHYWRAEHLATLTPTESWYPPSIFFQGMKFMLFGDPSLPLPAGASPSPAAAPPQ
jgi:hypothetical protein